MVQTTIKDAYRTLAGPAEGEYKDRGSKFLGFAWPVDTESDALAHIEALRKEHFKANHHCFAWRLGPQAELFRANDDGEPSGTAGRPMLGQIEALDLTNTVVVVVRYFGGTLLGTSGLIQAYRACAAATLAEARIKEVVLYDTLNFEVDYALMPELVNAIRKLDLPILSETYADSTAQLTVGIRRSVVDDTLLQLRAQLWKTSTADARTLDWPVGMVHLQP
jgi:uncharacterized YigZ family protein